MSGAQVNVITIDNPSADDFAAIAGPLDAFNTSRAGPDGHATLAILIKNSARQAVIGGLWGESFYDWMFVKLFFIPETLRGSGMGSRIMAEAERIALARGCTGIWLDTFEFQARGFYERLGFEVFGTLGDHPRGMNRYFLQKRLKPGNAGHDE